MVVKAIAHIAENQCIINSPLDHELTNPVGYRPRKCGLVDDMRVRYRFGAILVDHRTIDRDEAIVLLSESNHGANGEYHQAYF